MKPIPVFNLTETELQTGTSLVEASAGMQNATSCSAGTPRATIGASPGSGRAALRMGPAAAQAGIGRIGRALATRLDSHGASLAGN